MSAPKVVHWIGGVSHSRGVCLSGYPCCCSGRRCVAIAKDCTRCTRDPEEVTCRACLHMMAKDPSTGVEFHRGEARR